MTDRNTEGAGTGGRVSLAKGLGALAILAYLTGVGYEVFGDPCVTIGEEL